jgi:uncharacterized membrane protein
VRVLLRLVAIGILIWVAAIVWAPYAVASSRPANAIAAALVYDAGHMVCHQRPERSFALDGRPLPVCARCTGLYVSAAAAVPFALLLALPLPSRRARWLLGVAALPTAITWSIEFAGLAHPSNLVRAVAALPLGFMAAWVVVATMRTGVQGRMH